MKMQTVEIPLAGDVSYQPLPKNVAPEDREHFLSLQQDPMPPASVAVYQGAEVRGRGPVWFEGEPQAESFVEPKQVPIWRRRGGAVRAALEACLQRCQPLDEPALWITDNWSCGYFHWMCDALPRLELAGYYRRLSDFTLVLPYKFRRYDYFLPSLQCYGLKTVRLLRRFERLRCGELVMPSHLVSTGRFRQPVIRAMRRRIDEYLATRPPLPTFERLYISRSRATRRRIENENEILPVLESHDFEVIVAEDHSWEAQMRLAAAAKYMVSNHGAGLTNLMMMRPGSSVLELRSDEQWDQGCYFNLAAAAQVNYYYLKVRRGKPSSSAHFGNVVVDPAKLDEALSEMINGSSLSSLRCA